MRLTTIWTMPAMSLRERLARTGDLAAQRLAAHLPGRVRYWAFIQVSAKAIPPHAVVTDMLLTDVLAAAEGGPR